MPSSPPLHRPQRLFSSQQNDRKIDADRHKKEDWRAWYWRKSWFALRDAQLRKEPLCESCLAHDRVIAATIVHHAEPHRGEWSKFSDPDNLCSVCKPCHDGEIQRGERAGWTGRGWTIEGQRIPPRVMQPLSLRPSAVPLTMLCGAPGAGKSTYMQANSKQGDVLIDIDAILNDLSGVTIRTKERRERYLLDAFIERNRRLASLADQKEPIAAWFIIGAPSPSMRQLWAEQLKPSAIIVFETNADTCRMRINGEQSRSPTADGMKQGVEAWWDRYDRAPCDTKYIS